MLSLVDVSRGRLRHFIDSRKPSWTYHRYRFADIDNLTAGMWSRLMNAEGNVNPFNDCIGRPCVQHSRYQRLLQYDDHSHLSFRVLLMPGL